MTREKNVVVVGAGVAGLTTALVLTENRGFAVTVAGEHLPGDDVSLRNTRASEWDRATFPYLLALTGNSSQTGVSLENCLIWNREEDLESSVTSIADWASEIQSGSPWFKEIVPEFRVLNQEQTPLGFDTGVSFKTICINVPVYLQYLFSVLNSRGVVFKRGVLSHITEAAALHHSGAKADVVVNCTGIMASKLGGVEDKNVYPARGQICIVRNQASAMVTTSGTYGGPPDHSDIFDVQPRAGGGTIIGGSYRKHDWNGDFDPELAKRMMKRAVELCPELTGGKGPEELDVIRHTVGLRPCREGGTRVEKELIEGVWVVHNYGHGGFGYQCSYGCSRDAVDIIKEVVKGGLE